MPKPQPNSPDAEPQFAADGMPADAASLTPAMRQYVEQKRQVQDAILLFRMGDFYELFYEDAKVAAKLLGITLTSRDTGRTPLAGIPYHALDGYLAKLVAAGKKVAISEQIEDAAAAKGVIQRSVVRIVTPGTLTEDSLLDRSRANTLAAVWRDGQQSAGIAALELSTGEFTIHLCDETRVIDELIRAAPAEVLLPESRGVGRDPLELDIGQRVGASVTYRTAADFSAHRAEQVLLRQFETRSLAGFGFERVDAALQAAGALVAYAIETQKGAVQHIRAPRRRPLEQFVVLDAVTLRSLEVERTMRGSGRDGSLLGAVDYTSNPMGARLLRAWLCYPLRDVAAIEHRQHMIEVLRGDAPTRKLLRDSLRAMGDLERMIGRLGVFRITPRDLRLLGTGLSELPAIRQALRALHTPATQELLEPLDGLDEIAGRLCAALRADAPTTVKEGGIFQQGTSPELDRLHALTRDGERWLVEYQAAEQQRTGIPSLKVAFNSVFGYYIEITNTHRDRVPAGYVRRQTVKNAERYITDELKKHEQEVLTAETRASELEHQMFLQLRDEAARSIARVQSACAALAQLDVLCGWAELAQKRSYVRPEFVAEPLLEIDEGRHPVVEQVLEDQFVPNDTRLDATGKSLALITGPNMAGKSTYIRQVATLALLAHCGCFVPARRMQIGVVDRIFTRVGASDEL
ncbi:MAG: DNA mismatch repair protein MutS, partial [Phycisphaerae bacterium]